ncbi:MAG: LysR substrate-binding domain-containing protein [Geminicoccaceae bacterium]|nr:LysR family transcriptional regulator [Geminicoccaceae bacterium]
MLDWDRVRIFHAVAGAGSFTRAADRLGLSQSAISRQIGALEEDLGVALFHRHARGLLLTEHGEILLETATAVARRMASMQSVLGEVRNTATGHLRVNTTVGIGTVWLVSHLREFRERYPEITVTLFATDSDLDLSMREADVAIRLHQPTQSDLVQRRLMTVHTHIYASDAYIEKRGAPQSPGELSMHDLIAYGDDWQPPVQSLNWILEAGMEDSEEERRTATLKINNVFGMLRAAECGLGLASLPDYLGAPSTQLKRVLSDIEGPTFTAYFVYPEELRSSKRVAAFRDFLLEKVAAQPVW